MRRLVPMYALLLLSLAAHAAGAPAGQNVGAHRGGDFPEATKILDEKCLACHNPKSIEADLRKKRDFQEIIRHMEGKGVVLTDHEREVMQHFWKGKAFKNRDQGQETRDKQKAKTDRRHL